MPVHGAPRHDAHASGASGLKGLRTDLSAVADLGYVGVAGIELVLVNDCLVSSLPPLKLNSTPP
jgi:hypothetical protein